MISNIIQFFFSKKPVVFFDHVVLPPSCKTQGQGFFHLCFDIIRCQKSMVGVLEHLNDHGQTQIRVAFLQVLARRFDNSLGKMRQNRSRLRSSEAVQFIFPLFLCFFTLAGSSIALMLIPCWCFGNCHKPTYPCKVSHMSKELSHKNVAIAKMPFDSKQWKIGRAHV